MNFNGYNEKNGRLLERIVQNEMRLGKCATEISGDFVLPEYLPEIRRLLRIGVIVSPPTKYISASQVRLSGTVDYGMIYVGGDGEIYSTRLPSDYEISSALLGEGGYGAENIEIVADAYPEAVTGRVTGARKLNIKCRIASDVRAIDRMTMGGDVAAFGDGHIQRLIKNVECCTCIFGENRESEVVHELDINGDERYINTDCRVFIERVNAFDGYAECEGRVVLRHLMSKSNGDTYVAVHKVDFSETVEMDGMKSGMPVSAYGRCSLIEVAEAHEGSEEGNGGLTVSARLYIAAQGFKSESFDYVKDVYSTVYDCETVKSAYDVPIFCSSANVNMTLSESKEIEALGIATADGMTVVDSIASARAESVVKNDNGSCVINGKCRFNVIVCKKNADADPQSNEYSVVEAEVPFKYELGGGVDLPESYSVEIEAIEPNARFDGDKLGFSCELAICLAFMSKERIELVSDIHCGEEHKLNKNALTVCYPEKRDSLWSIAKRYRTSVGETAKENGIDDKVDADLPEAIEGIKYIIV